VRIISSYVPIRTPPVHMIHISTQCVSTLLRVVFRYAHQCLCRTSALCVSPLCTLRHLLCHPIPIRTPPVRIPIRTPPMRMVCVSVYPIWDGQSMDGYLNIWDGESMDGYLNMHCSESITSYMIFTTNH
jgi:hypothetical protein